MTCYAAAPPDPIAHHRVFVSGRCVAAKHWTWATLSSSCRMTGAEKPIVSPHSGHTVFMKAAADVAVSMVLTVIPSVLLRYWTFVQCPGLGRGPV